MNFLRKRNFYAKIIFRLKTYSEHHFEAKVSIEESTGSEQRLLRALVNDLPTLSTRFR